MATERIPLTQPIESRVGNFLKDSRSVNCVFESRDQKREFLKRPGLVTAKQVVSITPPAETPSQGLVEFNSDLYSVINNTLYKTVATAPYTTTTVGSTSVSTSQSYFVKTFLGAYLFMHNKLNGYLLSKAGVFSGIVNDKVVSVSIDNEGLGYSGTPTITFTPPPSGTTATGTVVMSSTGNGSIVSITIDIAGSGYVTAPTATINPWFVTVPNCTNVSGTTTIDYTGYYGALFTGMVVSTTGIPTGALITKVTQGSILGSGTMTLSIATTGSVSGNVTATDARFTATAAVTPNLCSFPTGPYVSGTVFLDNYVFIGTVSTAMSTDLPPVPVGNRIYNSALGDPTSWSALDYLSFEQTTDTLVGIAKHLNYLVAFGQTSTQFYYDNANPVGSPLSVSQSYTSEVGCASGDSIVSTDNTVLWVGTSKTYGRAVYLMDGVSPVKVSTDNIDKHLEADGLGKVSAYCYKFGGHTLYILTLHNTNETLVFDINEKMWYQWTQYSMMSSDQSNPGVWMESYFRPTFYAEALGVPFVLDDDTATIYYFDTNTYQDANQPIYCRTVTDVIDNGSTKRKFYGRLEIIGDKVAGTLQVRHTGDDYNTWSSYRSIDLNASRAQIYLSGADRRRAWEFLCTSNVPLRLDGAEIDFRIGELDQEQSTGGGRYRK